MKKLICEFSKDELLSMLNKQLSNFFFLSDKEVDILSSLFDIVYERLYQCIAGVDNKYFRKNDSPFFSPYHSSQYCIYLYLYSNTCSKRDFKELGDKLYYLNKIMHSCDIYHEVELPTSFFFEHPIGTVLGRAKYGNNFTALQGCTIGGNKGKYPKLGEKVTLLSNAKVIGDSNIGYNVIVAANTYIKDTNIESNSIVFGTSPNLIIKRNKS